MATITLHRPHDDTAARTAVSRPGHIVSPLADLVLLAGSPLIALAVAGVAFGWAGEPAEVVAALVDHGTLGSVVSTLVVAHLLVTFVRTHGDPEVFARHPWRFSVVPLAVFGVLAMSHAARLAAIPLLVAWDVHHSGMQTFGLVRHYARRAGQSGTEGRLLDLLLCHATYGGMVLAGAGLLIHVRRSGSFRWTDLLLTTLETADLRPFRIGVLALCGLVVLARTAQSVWLWRRGVPVSGWATLLLVSTAITSAVSWGFDSFGMALATMKLFHCVQYFTMVAATERGAVSAWLGRTLSWRSVLLLLLVPCVAMALALRVGAPPDPYGGPGPMSAALVLTLTLLHFWYDGFIWSARRAP